jgi:hypothetical protein
MLVRGLFGRLDRSFDLTRDGYSLLAFGFTGAKALRFKVRYIEAFNAMEVALQRRRRATRANWRPADRRRRDDPGLRLFGYDTVKLKKTSRWVSWKGDDTPV